MRIRNWRFSDLFLSVSCKISKPPSVAETPRCWRDTGTSPTAFTGRAEREICVALQRGLVSMESSVMDSFILSVADTRENRVLMNHPVHIVDSDTGKTSPSAFIPFCDFAGKMGDVGTKLPEFDLPVCNSFTKTVIDGQLCYELEVNKFYTEPRVEEQLTKGLTLILDYNEDRNLIRVNEGEERREINIVDNIACPLLTSHTVPPLYRDET